MSEIKILFLADTHLGYDFPIKPRSDVRRRGVDFFNNFDISLKYAVENKFDMLIHGGDLFHMTKVPDKIINMVYERIFDFAEEGIPILIVPGNHESSQLPQSLFTQHPNIHIFHQAQNFKFNIKNKEIVITGFPFVRNNVRDNFPLIMNELKEGLSKGGINILCMHQAIEGSRIPFSNFVFRYGEDVVKINDIPDEYDLTLSGHIHHQQILFTKNNKDVIYPGSIERTSIAEKDEEKGFFCLYFDNDNSYNTEFVTLPSRPMNEILIKSDVQSKEELIMFIKNEIKKISVDSIVRIKAEEQAILYQINADFIREVFPKTMNVQLSGLNYFKKNMLN